MKSCSNLTASEELHKLKNQVILAFSMSEKQLPTRISVNFQKSFPSFRKSQFLQNSAEFLNNYKVCTKVTNFANFYGRSHLQ